MLKVYNTLTKKKEEFEPLHPPFVGMYVCGPTVYDDPHLGHAKSYVSFDVIVRFLRASGYKVRYVQNITDVGHLLGEGDEGEDRIIKRAKLEKLEPIEIAQKYERHYFRDMDKLNCLRPDISCRATGHIPEMIALVEKLIDKGYGYEVDGDVYFDISKFKDYGKLSGKKVEDLKEGVRVEVAKGKRNPIDFALWKKADKNHIMKWHSPWSMGYPGWHLECSVMSMKYLGESIDIHGGGLDNVFPHHECEIAQSEAANGKPFVKYWLHNNMITTSGEKMSKSLGNFATLHDLFQVYPPMTLRLFLLQGHYRSPQAFSEDALEAAQKGYDKLKRAVLGLRELLGDEKKKGGSKKYEKWQTYRDQFFEYMEDDFNTSGAISVLFNMVRDITSTGDTFVAWGSEGLDQLKTVEMLFTQLGEDILGLKFEDEEKGLESKLIQLLIDLREEFRRKKDWSSADEIRDKLESMGIILEDGKDRAKWRRK